MLNIMKQGRLLKTKINPAEKKFWRSQKLVGKKKKGCGENEFLPTKPVCRRQTRTRKRFRYSALAEHQNRKIFVSLIEKICEGAIKKMFRKFFCFARRSRGERKRWTKLLFVGQ